MSDKDAIENPREHAFDAIADFESVCDDLEDESPALRLKKEADAFEDLTDTLAECITQQPTLKVGPMAKTISDVSHSLTKTDAKSEITSKSQSAKAEGNGRQPLDEWVEDSLQECRIVSTTDHIDDTRYVWDFGAVTVETTGGKEGRGHYDWINFRDSIDEAGGPYLAEPNDPLTAAIEWRNWIVDQRDDHKTTKRTVGLRTSAVEYLQNRVRRADAYGSLRESVDYNGAYVEIADDKPDDVAPVDTDETPQELPEWRVGTIYVPNEWPVEAAEEFGITTRALQNEIDARGFMLDGHSKIATREYVGGEYATFWVLDGDFATPAMYTPEGEASGNSGGVDALEADNDSEADDTDFGAIGGDL